MNIAATLVAIGVMPLKTNFKQITCASSAVFSGRLKLTSLSGFKAGITETNQNVPQNSRKPEIYEYIGMWVEKGTDKSCY